MELQRGVVKINEERCIMCGKPIPEGRMVCYDCECSDCADDKPKSAMRLSNIDNVEMFVRLTSTCDGDVIVKSGRFAVNGKSFIGLSGIDLSNPVTVEFYCEVPHEVQETMRKYVVKKEVVI